MPHPLCLLRVVCPLYGHNLYNDTHTDIDGQVELYDSDVVKSADEDSIEDLNNGMGIDWLNDESHLVVPWGFEKPYNVMRLERFVNEAYFLYMLEESVLRPFAYRKMLVGGKGKRRRIKDNKFLNT